jgi:Protein of unknown function (DUF2911)
MLLMLISVSLLSAKDKEKRASPMATAKGKNVSVTYSRPYKKGRAIFGSLVPYGEVWRTGANEATEITFAKSGSFAGKPVKAGTYTLFTIPTATAWTVILNSELKQWGAFGYDKVKDKDVLQATVQSTHLDHVVEQFTITVKDNGLLLEWDQTSVLIPMSF